MIGMSSLDLLAFPLRHTVRTIAAVIDARKGELFYAFYKPVPGGVQRVLEPRCGRADDLVADLMARGDDVLCVGDGALRYRDELTAARQGYSVAVQAGVNVQLWRGIHLAVLGEEMFTSFYSQAFRVFGALTADWTLRVGR